jgi:hypothetical protein
MTSDRSERHEAIIGTEIHRIDTLLVECRGSDVWMNPRSLESPTPACYTTSPRTDTT